MYIIQACFLLLHLVMCTKQIIKKKKCRIEWIIPAMDRGSLNHCGCIIEMNIQNHNNTTLDYNTMTEQSNVASKYRTNWGAAGPYNQDLTTHTTDYDYTNQYTGNIC